MLNNVVTAFEQIYNATYDKVSFYVLTKCGKIPAVEDILQEIYAELFQVLEDKGDAYIVIPEAFVMQLAKSKIYRFYSDRERWRACRYVEVTEAESAGEKVYTAQEDDWQDALVNKLTAEEVMAYLAEKDELTREIFYQHYFQDKTLKEIAKSIGMKETTVKKRLYRTLQELRGMKRFAMIIAILLLAALLAKPVYTWAEEIVYSIKNYLAEDIADIILCGAFYKKYKVLVDNGTVSENVCININDVEYSFADLEKIWKENPWLTKLNWNGDESAEEMEKEGDFSYIEVDSYLEIQQ